METILVPIDFSKNSENALHFASNLAEKRQARLIVFHSYHTHHTSAYVSANSFDRELRTLKEHTDQKLKDLYAHVGGSTLATTEFVSSDTEFHEEMLRLVTERGIDLIVMGTQGSGSRLEGNLFGTNTSWVVEKVKCPVIAIPENQPLEAVKEIVYASDYVPGDIDNLQQLMPIAQAFNASVTVIHITKDESADAVKTLARFEQQVKTEIGTPGIRFRLIKGASIEKTLDQYIAENKVDLLVMSAHQRSLPEKLFGKSMTKIMTLYSHISLMIFHQKVD
ncbi:universal stress protein [Spirosoma panaciterrae]|uniref:universal stress protein n=1 Tax=Spirosoma panaciterrae TaxID=496058 RepID=UPI000376176F|nr:universal stress protein [Spirosoma panaciterrae]